MHGRRLISMRPIRGDVKRKFLSLLSERAGPVVSFCIQPDLQSKKLVAAVCSAERL
jgi:hypothetical protein